MIRRRKRAPEDSSIDITPMLDIVFIMLIFIVTTTFIKETARGNRPNASTAVADEKAIFSLRSQRTMKFILIKD